MLSRISARRRKEEASGSKELKCMPLMCLSFSIAEVHLGFQLEGSAPSGCEGLLTPSWLRVPGHCIHALPAQLRHGHTGCVDG